MADHDMDRVVPLGQLDDFTVADGDPDVRGWEVLGADGRKVGEVDELLVDTSAMKVRYLDVDVDDGVIGDDRHVLIPIGYARLERDRDCVTVDVLRASDLRALPPYGQGPLTRDFENSVRDSFSRREAASPSPERPEGIAGTAREIPDTAGLDNTPGMGTGLGMALGAGFVDPSTGSMDVGTGPGRDSGVRDTGSMRPGIGPGRDTPAGGTFADRSPDAISAGPRGGEERSGRGPQGDMSHRVGMSGSDYLHNADEDFYASDAFDESRFYGARRGGSAEGGGMDRPRGEGRNRGVDGSAGR